MATLIANARMYAINADVARAWRTLLEWVIARAGADCAVIDYPPPLPLPALWARPDAGCVFMCGFPFAHTRPQPRLLGVPLPSPVRYRGAPAYATDIVVRADAPWRSLEDLIGRRFAFTTEDSQSGCQAARLLFAPFARARGGRLFAATVGPLVTPRRVVEAIVAGDADAGPLDSFVLDLLRLHEPALTERLRVVASTPLTPMPPLVAAPGTTDDHARRFTAALLEVAGAVDLASVRAALLLTGFSAVDPQIYDVLVDNARAADAAGYPRIA